MDAREVTFQAIWRASTVHREPRAHIVEAKPADDISPPRAAYVAVEFAGFWVGFESIDDLMALRNAIDEVIPEAVAAGIYPMNEPRADRTLS
jgi:hypothetical protein